MGSASTSGSDSRIRYIGPKRLQWLPLHQRTFALRLTLSQPSVSAVGNCRGLLGTNPELNRHSTQRVEWGWAEKHLRSLPPCQFSCAMLVTAASMTAKEMEWLSDFAAPVAAMPRKPASNRGQHQLPTAAQTND